MRHIENFNRFYTEICKTEVSPSFFSVAVTAFSRQKSHAKDQINLRMHLCGLHSVSVFGSGAI